MLRLGADRFNRYRWGSISNEAAVSIIKNGSNKFIELSYNEHKAHIKIDLYL